LSGQEQTQPNGEAMDQDNATVDEFLAAVRRHPDWDQPKASSWGHQTVIVDAETETVLASFDYREAAILDFYRRMDADVTVVDRLRVVQVNASTGFRVLWSSSMTAVERALRAEQGLGCCGFSSAEIVDRLWDFLLHGTALTLISSDGGTRRAAELWWPDGLDECATVGCLVEHETDEWRLLTVGNGLRPIPLSETVEEYIATEADWLLGSPDIAAEDVREVRRNRRERKPVQRFAAALIAYGIHLAHRFEVLDRTGDELQ
jgi:hypothetical protein